MKKITLLFLVPLLFLVQSCNSPSSSFNESEQIEEVLANDIKVQNGMLVFKNIQHFISTEEELKKLSPDELITWEKQFKNFESMNNNFNYLKNEIGKVIFEKVESSELSLTENGKYLFDPNEPFLQEVLKRYKSVFLTINNSLIINSYNPINTHLINKFGNTRIGNSLYQFSYEGIKVKKNYFNPNLKNLNDSGDFYPSKFLYSEVEFTEKENWSPDLTISNNNYYSSSYTTQSKTAPYGKVLQQPGSDPTIGEVSAKLTAYQNGYPVYETQIPCQSDPRLIFCDVYVGQEWSTGIYIEAWATKLESINLGLITYIFPTQISKKLTVEGTVSFPNFNVYNFQFNKTFNTNSGGVGPEYNPSYTKSYLKSYTGQSSVSNVSADLSVFNQSNVHPLDRQFLFTPDEELHFFISYFNY